ncbi:MAG TPA: VTT domain-containing protein [Acidobacteriota bacterium]|nr:VTT domain-containing protein [Acidobacteriota bacterium]
MNVLMLAPEQWWTRLWAPVSAAIHGFTGLGVMLLALGDSSFFSAPEANDLLIVLLSAGKSWGTMAYYVAMTTLGSVIGCFLLYSVGRKGGSPILKRRFSPEKVARAERLFDRYGILTVLIPSILPPPLPFKIFVLCAGVFRLNLFSFLTAVVIGRVIRYSIWGVLAVLYGNQIKSFLQQYLGEMGVIFFVVFLLIVAVIAICFIRRPGDAKSSSEI